MRRLLIHLHSNLFVGSIGQVHRATTHDGRAVMVKVQYPGVAESVQSDLNNLKLLTQYAGVIPRGIF